jgi:DNA-directed RNA polymerase II subunit RPB1
MMETFEENVAKVLSQARQSAGKTILRSITEKNNFKSMASAGSKGNETNISQIMGCVGPQNVEGKRIAFGFKHRALPHFRKDDLSAEAKGFVTNSYLKGLTAQEFYFHAMGGREGLIDTACKTSVTGYLQRRLVKAMESVMCQYDGTVRTSDGSLIQMLYGEDGLDGGFIELQDFPSVKMSEADFMKKYAMGNPTDANFGCAAANGDDRFITEATAAACRTDKALVQILEGELQRLRSDRERAAIVFMRRKEESGNTPVKNTQAFMPINVKRLLWKTKRDFKLSDQTPTSLSPKIVIEKVNKICSLFEEALCPNQYDPIGISVKKNGTELLQILVRSHFASKIVLQECRFTEDALDWILGEIISRYRCALVSPGEMCGVIAAQSIGQPATQMTLNTFHLAGVGNKNVTAGVPRLNEILNIAKHIKTPSMEICLVPELRLREGGKGNVNEGQKDVMRRLQMTMIGDLIDHTEVFYDPDPRKTVIERDQEIVTTQLLGADPAELERHSKWLLRIVFRQDRIAYLKVGMDEIKRGIEEEFEEGYFNLMASGDNVNAGEEQVLRLREIRNEDDLRLVSLEYEDPERLEVKIGGVWRRPVHAEEVHLDDRDPESAVVARRFDFDEGDYITVDAAELPRYVRPLDMSDDPSDIEVLNKIEESLSRIHLRGVPKVLKVYSEEKTLLQWTHETGFTETSEVRLTTDGTNLLDTLAFEHVDATRTTSNDVVEIFGVFGIEGVRTALYRMIRDLINEAQYVNNRHYAILADVMTFRGTLMSINRHGINRATAGPMLRCSFEESFEILMEAALFGRSDTLNGVTENIMCGQLARIGTGCIDLLIDPAKLKDAHETALPAVDAGAALFDDALDERPSSPTVSLGAGVMGYSPVGGSMFSPSASPFAPGGGYSPVYTGGGGGASPIYSPSGSDYSGGPVSPAYTTASSTSPASSASGYSTTSPAYSPTSPAYRSGSCSATRPPRRL